MIIDEIIVGTTLGARKVKTIYTILMLKYVKAEQVKDQKKKKI